MVLIKFIVGVKTYMEVSSETSDTFHAKRTKAGTQRCNCYRFSMKQCTWGFCDGINLVLSGPYDLMYAHSLLGATTEPLLRSTLGQGAMGC